MKSLKDVFKRDKKDKKKSKPSVSISKIKDWIEDGLARGYELGDLRERLIKHGLEKQAVNLIHTFPHPHKTYHYKTHKTYSQKKINTILAIVCALMLGLIIMLAPNSSNQNFMGPETGGHTETGTQNPSSAENTIIVDTTPHFKKKAENPPSYIGNIENVTDTETVQAITGGIISEGENPGAIVNVNFSDEVGKVRDNFYGVNTHGYWLRNGQDLPWHRQTFLDGGYSFSREDMSLGAFYDDGKGNWSILRKGDTTNITLEYEWARENHVKILNIISYMPSWLGDNSSRKCLDLTKCPPLNYTYFGEIVKDYINRTTLDGEYLDVVEYEFWNEPDVGFFMGKLPTDGIDKSIKINKMFDATSTIVRQSYPYAVIGGLGLADCNSENMRDNFLKGFSNVSALNFSNFFSCHSYITPKPGEYNIYTETQNQLNTIYEACKYTGAQETCKNIYISEFNLGDSQRDDLIKNTSSRSNEYAAEYSLFYAAALNSYPQNITMQTYQWADSQVYGPGYPEYPNQWYSVQEPALGIEYKPPYNVTKDFAHYHASGSMVVSSSSSNENIKVVVSQDKSGSWYITLINTGKDVDVSIDLSSLNIDGVKELQNGRIYTSANGIAHVGVLKQYDVIHYKSISLLWFKLIVGLDIAFFIGLILWAYWKDIKGWIKRMSERKT